MAVKTILLSVVLAGIVGIDALAIESRKKDGQIDLSALWSVDRVRPGDTVKLAVVFKIPSGYHINADAAQLPRINGFKPVPTRVTIASATDAFVFQPPIYPRAEKVAVGFLSTGLPTFSKQVVVVIPATLARRPETAVATAELKVDYQACDTEVCFFPQSVRLFARLPIAETGQPVSAVNPDLFLNNASSEGMAEAGDVVRFHFFGWRYSLNMAKLGGVLLLAATALLGGTLLNFTPCVLPLIPIKINSLAEAAQNRARCILLGSAMSTGILVFWAGLGTAIATIANFTAASQLFYYPAFTVAVGIFIALMGIGMSGFFTIQPPRFVYLFHPNPQTIPGAFVIGFLTAILATPCSAPFMGAAAAWAITQTPLVTTFVFAAIGGGMAGPYLLLSARPGWLAKMARSGPISLLVKETMGLLMFSAAAYFIGSGLSTLAAEPPNPPDTGYWWAVMGILAVAGLWMAIRSWRLFPDAKRRVTAISLGIVVSAISILGGMRLTDSGPIDWVYYTPERYRAARLQQQTVVMVFTAEWCLNCKALEQGVLHSPTVSALLSRKDVVPIKVDITGKNPHGRAKLQQIGSLTIPMLIIESPDGRILFRSDFYTVGQIQKALQFLPD